MNLREATEQALRELGMPENEIKVQIGHAMVMVPEGGADELVPGKEREAIDAMKELYGLIASSPLTRILLHEVMAQAMARKAAQN